MPTEKKSHGDGSESEKPKRKKPLLEKAIKVTYELWEKLEEVADDLDVYPGELIEQRMGAWLEAESFRIRKKKFDEAQKRKAGH